MLRPLLLLVLAGACVFAEDVTLATSDGWQLSATVWAPDAKKPSGRGVLLLHQLQHNRADWASLAKRLAKAGHAVLAFDFRGHGKSKKGDKTPALKDFADADFAAMVEDVRAGADLLLSRKELGVDSIAVVGAGLGADVALVWAASEEKAPVARLVLISPRLTDHGLPVEEAIGKVQLPTLFAACKEDHPGYEETMKMFESKHGKREFDRYGTGLSGTAILPKFPALADDIVRFVGEP